MMANTFNWWFIVAPSILLVAILMDAADRLRIFQEWDGCAGARIIWCERKRASRTLAFVKLVTLILGAGSVATLVVRESWRGLLALAANILGTTTGFFAIVLAFALYAAAMVAYFVALLYLLNYGRFVVVGLVYLANVSKLALIAVAKVIRALAHAIRSAAYVGRTMVADAVEPQEADEALSYQEEVPGVFTTYGEYE